MNQHKYTVIVSFVDVGGIVDHHCLNFLFTIIGKMNKSITTLKRGNCNKRQKKKNNEKSGKHNLYI